MPQPKIQLIPVEHVELEPMARLMAQWTQIREQLAFENDEMVRQSLTDAKEACEREVYSLLGEWMTIGVDEAFDTAQQLLSVLSEACRQESET